MAGVPRTAGPAPPPSFQPQAPNFTAIGYRELVRETAGIVGYWRLGELSGTTAVDQTGTPDGTYAGGYTLAQTGALVNDSDKAVLFDGVDGRVSLPGTPITGVDNWSLEAWIKPTLPQWG